MTLIVEDGTGKPDAQSFASVATADAQMAELGMTIWTSLNEPEKEQALRRATQYMEQVYRLRWQGYRTTNGQSLSWPRAEVPIPDAPGKFAGYYTYVNEYSVPAEVVRACVELALKAAAGPLYADQARAQNRVKVGDIEAEYSPYSSQAIKYVAIDALLLVYLTSSANSATLVRR
jgi:hypothetical protein